MGTCSSHGSPNNEDCLPCCKPLGPVAQNVSHLSDTSLYKSVWNVTSRREGSEDDAENEYSESDAEHEFAEEPCPVTSNRRSAVSAEAVGAFNKRFQGRDDMLHFEKPKAHADTCQEALRKWPFLLNIQSKGIEHLVNTIELEEFRQGDLLYERGAFGRSLYIVVSGVIALRSRPKRTVPVDDISESFSGSQYSSPRMSETWINEYPQFIEKGSVFGESTMLWGKLREELAYAFSDHAIVGKLKRDVFFNLVTLHEMQKRTKMQSLLRRLSLFEFLNDDVICRITDVLERKLCQAGEVIFKQGDAATDLYLLWEGDAEAKRQRPGRAELDEVVAEYHLGDSFGEDCFVDEKNRPHTVSCKTRCKFYVLRAKAFTRMFGNFKDLRQQSLTNDPRTLIANFCRTMKAFAVCRPTSRNAIAKMIDGSAVGKGLNVKGKSARLNALSGYVPFLQISNNSHKVAIEASPPTARAQIFFQSRWARDLASQHLKSCLSLDKESAVTSPCCIDQQDRYPGLFGLDLPEKLIRQAYIIDPDISFRAGCETGRPSEPGFMNMNLHALRSERPKVVLYQFDQLDPMNPQGLLMAYAEEHIKPVVSDFDLFTIGLRGQRYDVVDWSQQQMSLRMLDSTETIMQTDVSNTSWSARWLQVLKDWEEQGYSLNVPEYGFGDPTSTSMIKELVQHTIECGAVRHGAECFNMVFPQELDSSYLIIWDGFSDTQSRWRYVDEPGLRKFLKDRLLEGFAFPINPMWPVRDEGWYELYSQLQNVDRAHAFDSWFPPGSGLSERIDAIHECYPPYESVPIASKPIPFSHIFSLTSSVPLHANSSLPWAPR